VMISISAGVLQCVAVCCSVLQACCSVLQCVAVCCSVLQYYASERESTDTGIVVSVEACAC